MTNRYSFLKGAWKAIVPTIIVALPMLLQILPKTWLDLTLSGLILLVLNFLKVKYGVRIS